MASTELNGNNLPEIFYHRVKENPRAAFFSTKRGGEWKDLLAEEALDFVFRSIAGLQKIGFSKGDRICIFSENREEWILTDYAAQWLSGATTAIYTTSAPHDVEHILNSSEAKVLFFSNQEMFDRLGPLDRFPNLKFIVAWGSIDTKEFKSGHVQFLSKDDFLQDPISETEAKELLTKVDPDQMTILLYTSGTTGEPKGVVLSQKNIVANLRQMIMSIPLEDLAQSISFLPLSHIYERSLHSLLLLAGVKIYFAESIDSLIGNIAEVKPNIMIGVPRIFEKIYVKIQEGLRNAPLYKKLIAHFAFMVGTRTLSYRLKDQALPLRLMLCYRLADELVLKKIRQITGGELKYFVSGGAPLSREIASFFFQAGITILEGYGLSETMILSVNRPGRIRLGTVGEPFDGTEVKTDSDGEILVRGPQVMKGYLNAPHATTQVFTNDGWFRTGDIGELSADGYLTITDRKKELIITAGGKNVAPQPLENQLKKDPLIEQICLIGDQRKYITALIVPNLELCQSWSKHKGLDLESRKDFAHSEELRHHFQKEIDKLNSGLSRYETIKYFQIIDQAFSVYGGELTPTLKLKRRIIQQKYKEKIDEMYRHEKPTDSSTVARRTETI